MEGIPGIRLPELNAISKEEAEIIDSAVSSTGLKGFYVEKVARNFKNRDFFSSIPKEWRTDPVLIAEYIKNSALFDSIIHEERKRVWSGDATGLLGDEVTANESARANGSPRRTESGHKLNVAYLKPKGIDPSKVLFYRRTQPGEGAKPEMYWTSDFQEVASGLTAEISGEQRKNSVVLVSDLETLDTLGEGLIQDINDDSGISVRTIGSHEIRQDKVLFSIKNPEWHVRED